MAGRPSINLARSPSIFGDMLMLGKLRLRQLYAHAMPADPAELYDGHTIADRIIAAWPSNAPA